MRRIISFLALAALFLGTAMSQELNNNIIRFQSTEARANYVNELLSHDSSVEVTYVDNVFIGLITRHTDSTQYQKEVSALGRMRASGVNGILEFEQDQEFTISNEQLNAPWHLDRIDQRALPLDSKFHPDSSTDEINVYIADTGVRVSHSEFEGRATGAFSSVVGLRPGEDCHGHGSHVAALVAGKTFGVARSAKVHDIRVLNCRGSGSTSGIVQGMDWVARNAKKPAVMNMSLGGSFSATINRAVASLTGSGVTVVVAAGNENTDACSKSPASAPEAFTVGATDIQDNRSSFSNFGRCVNIYSPGTNILSAGIKSDSDTTTMSGTSMASPIVAGVTASVLQRNPSLSVEELKAKVLEIATTTNNQNINPFVYFEAGESEDPSQPDPEEPSKPEVEGVIAYISGSTLRKIDGKSPLVLDASFSHASLALQKEMCSSDAELSFSWICTGGIFNSELESTCNGEEVGTESVLNVSPEKLNELKGSGPVIFTVKVTMGDYTSVASNVVVVEDL